MLHQLKLQYFDLEAFSFEFSDSDQLENILIFAFYKNR